LVGHILILFPFSGIFTFFFSSTGIPETHPFPFFLNNPKESKYGNDLDKNCRGQVLEKLSHLKREDIIITPHAGIRAAQRNIGMEEIYSNLLNPSKLTFAEFEGDAEDGKKYCCYFNTSKKRFNLYVIVINNNVTVVTVFEANKKLQRRAEKNAKIPI